VTACDPQEQPAESPPDFEAALARLEGIVHELEEGQIGLAEALARYEEGVRLLKQCYDLLQSAERRIELLTGVDALGQPVTEGFDDSATLASPSPAASSAVPYPAAESDAPRRRSAAKRPRKPDAPSNADMDASPGLF